MSNCSELAFVACKIERGGFSKERVFEVEIPGRGHLIGTANVAYLRARQFDPLPQDAPEAGSALEGFVQCRILRPTDGGYVVEFPSTDVAVLEPDALLRD